MTKKLTYQGLFKTSLLMDELQDEFPGWNPVTSENTPRMQSKPDLDDSYNIISTEVYLFVPDTADEAEIQVVIDAHDPDALSVGEQRQANWEEDEVIAKTAKQNFRNMPQWATMTPQEADQYIANNVTDLASAKIVLRKMAIMLMHLRDVAIRKID